MRPSRLVPLLLSLFATTLFAGTGTWGVFPIVGAVNNFRSDTRIYNPSTTRDISVNLILLPTGNFANNDAIGRRVVVTIPKQSMVSYDDVAVTVFGQSGLGALMIDSTAPFTATTRIYATTPAGTLGQFTQMLDVATYARTSAVLLQLRNDAAFRTNLGFVNIQNNVATVTAKLFNGNNDKIAETTFTMPAYAAIAPTPLTSSTLFGTAASNLANGYVTYTTDINGRVIGYASVVDNASTDGSFVPPQSVEVP